MYDTDYTDIDWLDWMMDACVDCSPDVPATTMTGESKINVLTWLFELENKIHTGAGYHLNPAQITSCKDYLNLTDELEYSNGSSTSKIFYDANRWLNPTNYEQFVNEFGTDACPLDPFYDDENIGRFLDSNQVYLPVHRYTYIPGVY